MKTLGRWLVYSRVFQLSIKKCIDKHVKEIYPAKEKKARNLTTNG